MGVFCDGFNDWKNSNVIASHAKGPQHILAIANYQAYRNIDSRIDHQLESQYLEERDYWRNILKRVIETIIFIAERGLAFRGSDDNVGSKSNGNFLGILELLAKFDPFLAQHINEHANRGRGHTSYLSKTICNELITIIADKTLEIIVNELKDAGYYSVSVDSTPDVSHVDQLTVIFRYVLPSGPIERFVTFIDIYSHTGENLAKSLLDFIAKNKIDIDFCRGQSYDNAGNMSGQYKGMQAILKKHNPLIEYIPCAAHSLNLVGQSAVDCCVEAFSFFGNIQNVYKFFSASTYRWTILSKEMPKGISMPKRQSDTRWSANAEAVILIGYNHVLASLTKLEAKSTQKPETKTAAKNLANSLKLLETRILLHVWNEILQPFDRVNKQLQSSKIDLSTAVNLLQSLEIVLEEIREKYDEYEEKAFNMVEMNEYRLEQSQ
ncbi:zinc finger MYM-type protein 1-like [Temnothorax nylanderi]|uniref:zinc finger MYM-type protein 1-like n=1 Tax=Temnothorax nylanderi TaxID=102681 RepID=UPI003A89B23C